MLEATGEKIGMEFLPQLVMCSGFFIIYLVEEIVGEAMKHIKKSAELEHILSQGPNSGCCHTKQVCHNDMEINMRPNANGNVPQPNNNSNRWVRSRIYIDENKVIISKVKSNSYIT